MCALSFCIFQHFESISGISSISSISCISSILGISSIERNSANISDDINTIQTSTSLRFNMIKNLPVEGTAARPSLTETTTEQDLNVPEVEPEDNYMYDNLLTRAIKSVSAESPENEDRQTLLCEMSELAQRNRRDKDTDDVDAIDSCREEVVAKGKNEISQLLLNDLFGTVYNRDELPMEVDYENNGVVGVNYADEGGEVCRPKEHNTNPAENVVEVCEDDLLNKEVIAVKFAAIKVAALKTVQCVLASQKYGEMLLVPTSDLVADSSKALTDGTVVRKDEDFKKVICEFMKMLILVATSASPFKRAVGIDELDRTRAMLLKIVRQEQAERRTNLKHLKGQFSYQCNSATPYICDRMVLLNELSPCTAMRERSIQ